MSLRLLPLAAGALSSPATVTTTFLRSPERSHDHVAARGQRKARQSAAERGYRHRQCYAGTDGAAGGGKAMQAGTVARCKVPQEYEGST